MKYGCIYADPPWEYEDDLPGKRGAAYKYPTMPSEDIIALPVSQIALDDCFLFLWVTAAHLFVAKDVIASWGFEYKTIAFVWTKMNKKQTWIPYFGMGRQTRLSTEIVLGARRGRPNRASNSVRQWYSSPIQEHSRKPDAIRSRIDELVGDVPRIEMFATKVVPDWTALGSVIDDRDIRVALAREIKRREPRRSIA